MLKQEIVEKITKYFRLTNYEAEKIYDDVFRNITQGVKHDNISEVLNLGEFILKLSENEGSVHGNTVEFLPAANLEEEISSMAGGESMITSGLREEINKTSEREHVHEVHQEDEIDSQPVIPPPIVIEEQPKTEQELKPITPPLIIEEPQKIEDKVNTEPEPFVQESKTELKQEEKPFIPEDKPAAKPENPESLEEEMKRKREEIVHKLDPQHKEAYHPLLHVTTGIPLNVPKPVVIKEPVYKDELTGENAGKDEIVNEEITQKQEEVKEEVIENKDEITAPVVNEPEKEKEEVNELSSKSFSDYFREVKEEQKPVIETPPPVIVPPVQQVIPPAAVDLHKDIVGEKITTPPPPTVKSEETTGQVSYHEGNGYDENVESKGSDNSYYIWYKDSEPNAVDTQTMSYEYELLYQATKEAEYKSKLRIYVTTFILFFSIVLVLLIFSPVLYKYFFTTPDEQKTEPPPVEQTTSSNNESQSQQTQDNNTQNVTSPQQTGQNTQQQTETNNPAEQTQAEQNTAGLTKTDIGWKDDKNRVVYVQLENGKYAIQESSWDSEDKANKRISKVGSYNISGMTGNFVKADLGAKGTWFRVRFGDFTSLDEARKKAGELRNKEP